MYPIFHRFLHFVWKAFLVSNNLPYKSRTGILSLIGWGQQIWSISWCNFLSRLWHTCTYTDVHAHTYIHGPLTRCVKWRVAHAPGMPGTFLRHRIQTKPLVSDHSMHFGIVNPRWRGKHPGIPGACATHDFTYLVRGPCTCLRGYIGHCGSYITWYNFLVIATSFGSRTWRLETLGCVPTIKCITITVLAI